MTITAGFQWSIMKNPAPRP